MEKNKTHNCFICELNSSCLCFKCQNYYCEKCFKLVHDYKKNGEHKKELIDSFIFFDLKCTFHKDQINSLVCVEDKSKSFY